MARAPKWVAPNLDNATPEFLLDEMGNLSLMESQVKKMRAFYKEAYYARVGIKKDEDGDYIYEGEVIPPEGVVKTGERFIATTVQSIPARVSTTMLKEKYPKIAEECTVMKPQVTTRFNLAEGVVNPVVNELLAQLRDELGLDDEDD